MSTRVELDFHDRVARIVFRSENGIQILSSDTRRQLAAILDRLEEQADCSVVVLAAEGRTFLAGADLKELRGLNSKTAYRFAVEGHQLIERIASLEAVTLAAIHAPCVGGGCEMVLACDMRIAAAAARIGLPEVTLGVLPGWGGSVRAMRLLGPAVARRIVLTGELFPADAALHMGLVDAVHPDDEFPAAVQARVDMLLQRGPRALHRAKQLMRELQDERNAIAPLLELEAREFAACYETGEPQEGVAAFLEKRTPDWSVSLPGSGE